jgi:hypothetical protein
MQRILGLLALAAGVAAALPPLDVNGKAVVETVSRGGPRRRRAAPAV